MTYYKRSKNIFKIVAAQLLVGLVMAVLAFCVIFYAQGYRVNIKNFKIIKTGLIYLVSYPKDTTVFIDNKIVTEKTPYTVGLRPGNYNVLIAKEGYHVWEKNIRVESELVSDYKTIVMFKSIPEIKNLTDQRKINMLNIPIDIFAVSKSDDLLINNDYEIWQNNKLVTRFSKPIKNITWYNDEHILFQQDDEIRVIEIDGGNNTLLIKLSSGVPSIFTVNNKGDELYFTDNGEYKVAKIR